MNLFLLSNVHQFAELNIHFKNKYVILWIGVAEVSPPQGNSRHNFYINAHSGGLNLRLKCVKSKVWSVKNLVGGYLLKVVAS